MKFLALLALCVVGCDALALSKKKLDINQKVTVEGVEVLGGAAGEAALNQCNSLTPNQVAHAAAPKVKVCGTQIKATVFLRGRCEAYHDKQWEVGTCNTGAASDSCVEYSPADDKRMGAAQSYKIEMCG